MDFKQEMWSRKNDLPLQMITTRTVRNNSEIEVSVNSAYLTGYNRDALVD